MTGDLLILSGSSVTLKKKTNVSVRNQLGQPCFNINPLPSPLPVLIALISSTALQSIHVNQPITTQDTTTGYGWITTNLHSLHWNTGWMWNNQTNEEGWTNAQRVNQCMLLWRQDPTHTHTDLMLAEGHLSESNGVGMQLIWNQNWPQICSKWSNHISAEIS